MSQDSKIKLSASTDCCLLVTHEPTLFELLVVGILAYISETSRSVSSGDAQGLLSWVLCGDITVEERQIRSTVEQNAVVEEDPKEHL